MVTIYRVAKPEKGSPTSVVESEVSYIALKHARAESGAAKDWYTSKTLFGLANELNIKAVNWEKAEEEIANQGFYETVYP
jgi:hypothetical protein